MRSWQDELAVWVDDPAAVDAVIDALLVDTVIESGRGQPGVAGPAVGVDDGPSGDAIDDEASE